MEKYIEVARERVSIYPDRSVELKHLLAVLIGSRATSEMCDRLADYGYQYLSEMTVWELENEGLTEIEAQKIVAGFDLARKMLESHIEKQSVIRSPEDVAEAVKDMRFLNQEHFVCLFMDTKNNIIRKETIFVGSLNTSVVHPREVFKNAIRYSAASIICVHNHPSGDPTPSQEDIHVTKRLADSSKLIGIQLLDHIIIGNRKFISLREKGYI